MEKDIVSSNVASGVKLICGISEFKKFLECPLCEELLLPPITLCSKGHAICKTCKTVFDRCPVCRTRFTSVRDLFAEHFLEHCTLRCKNHGVGCEIELPGRLLVTHQEECVFRPVNCHTCMKNVIYHLYLEHIQNEEKLVPHVGKEYHGVYDIDPSKTKIKESYITWEPVWMEAYKTNFFCFLESFDNNCWLWVSAYASEEECDKYICTISVSNKRASTEVKYVGKVHHIRKTSSDVFHSGKCLVFLNTHLKNLKDNNGLEVFVSIDLNKSYEADATGSGEMEGSGSSKLSSGEESADGPKPGTSWTDEAQASSEVPIRRIPIVSVGSRRTRRLPSIRWGY